MFDYVKPFILKKDIITRFRSLTYDSISAIISLGLPHNVTKHIDEDLWELRPGNNRIFYFFYNDNCFVLLHSFRKKAQKTPRREIDKAKAKRDDYLSRKED